MTSIQTHGALSDLCPLLLFSLKDTEIPLPVFNSLVSLVTTVIIYQSLRMMATWLLSYNHPIMCFSDTGTKTKLLSKIYVPVVSDKQSSNQNRQLVTQSKSSNKMICTCSPAYCNQTICVYFLFPLSYINVYTSNLSFFRKYEPGVFNP